jgi:hypothetical protein
MLNEHCRHGESCFIDDLGLLLVVSSFWALLLTLYQQRFLRHLSGEFDAMTNCAEATSLICRVTTPITVTV